MAEDVDLEAQPIPPLRRGRGTGGFGQPNPPGLIAPLADRPSRSRSTSSAVAPKTPVLDDSQLRRTSTNETVRALSTREERSWMTRLEI
jgi:hypothetical protein